ncbi:MAG: NosD domain-containing protein [Candidatus Aenigmatarchaeota archaeon]
MELNISSKFFLIILFSLSFFLILVLKAFPDAGLRDDLNVTLLSPENNKVVNTKNVNFTFEVEWDDSSIVIKNCTLFGNFTGEWAANETNQTEIVEGENGIYLENLEDGAYEWNVYCFNETEEVYEYAENNRTVIIDAVSPFYLFGCSDLDEDGATYYLDNDIESSALICMNISAKNVILDCQGHTIKGNASASFGIGIYINRTSQESTNITVKNCTVTNWSTTNILIMHANDNTLQDITSISSPNHGILIYSSSTNKIINSTFSGNLVFDFSIFASVDSECNNYLENVKGTGAPIKYFNSSVTLTNEVLSELVLCNADNSNIINVTIRSYPATKNNALYVHRTDNSNFTNINSSYNRNGIILFNSSKNTIINSTFISNEDYGIHLFKSPDNKVINSIIGSNKNGIYIQNSSSNKVNSCIIQNNSYGIKIGYSENNFLFNNLLNNTDNVFLSGATILPNFWNTTKQSGTRIHSPGNYIGGNYWTNSTNDGYSDICTDNNKDGFCDSALNISNMQPCTPGVDCGENVDFWPLSDEYVAPSPPSPSLPSLGPGAGAPLTTVSTTPGKAIIFIPLIAAMSKANVSIQKTEGIDFTQIVISVRNRVTSVQINITKLDEKPEEVPALVNVYRYIRVDKKNIHDENITEVKLRFRVQKSWINSNNIKLDSIALYRYTYRWEKLNTLRIGEDSEDIYFEASSPGLSYFAIAGEKSKQTCPYECCIGEAEYYDKACTSGYKCENHACIPIVTPCTEDWVCSEWTACIGGKQTRVCMDRNRCGTVANKPEEERICEEKPEEKLPILVFWLGIIVVILAIFIITKIIAKKLQTKVEEKPKPKEKPKVELKKKPKKKR